MANTVLDDYLTRLDDAIGECVDEALAGLVGLSADELVAYLRKMHFTGERDNCDRCPIANYLVWYLRERGLWTKLHDPWVCVDIGTVTVMHSHEDMRRDVTCYLPAKIGAWVANFDGGAYDDLVKAS